MTGSGDMLARRCKTHFSASLYVCWILFACFLALSGRVSFAQTQTNSPFIAPEDSFPGDFSNPGINQNYTGTNAAAQTYQPSAFGSFPGGVVPPDASRGTNDFSSRLAMARYFEKARELKQAEPILISLLARDVPDSIQRAALFDLGAVVRDENDLPRAQAIDDQFLDRWPDDVRVPEILLRQGEMFRQMGLNDLALGKFYSVMTSALSLKTDKLAYYQRLVLQTQVEIADTHYLMGQFSDAAEFYSRLLQKTDPALNRPQIQLRLIRSLAVVGRYDKAIGEAQDFLSHYADTDEAPEVRYYLAEALKKLGRNGEALQQVLLCLKEQKAITTNDPDLWRYWQQRVGNEIGNQLYREGDYVSALEIYVNLAQLDSTPTWQIPVQYQIGMTYEHLMQPQKAIDAYDKIVEREAEVGTNATPGLKAVFDMASWRASFLKWQGQAEAVNRSLEKSSALIDSITTNQPVTTR